MFVAFSRPSSACKNSVWEFFVAFSWPSFWAKFTRTRPGKRDAAFLLTVGSFLLTVELFDLQLTILAFLLTIGASLLTVLALLLTVRVFCLQWEKCV